MKPTLFGLLAAMLLVTSAYAEETVTAASAGRQVKLEVKLYEIPTAMAVAAGLDSEEVGSNEINNARFSVFPADRPITALIDPLLVKREARLMMETEIAAISGLAAAVTQMKPMPNGVAHSSDLSKFDAEAAQFGGMMGYHIGLTPTVDERGYTVLDLHAVVAAPGITRELQIEGYPSPPVQFQSMRTSLRIASGTTICVANIIPMDTRIALANALQAASGSEGPHTFPATSPAPGSSLYLTITPTPIEEH